MWLGSPRPSVSLLAHLDFTAETAPELNREPLAVEREPDVHRTGWRAITSVEEFPTRTPERSDRDALFGSPVIGSRRVSARGPAASFALAARL
jgi:hypothetical protein